MHLRRLHLHDFRSYAEVELEPAPGLTAIVGDNGQGKTNLLEAVAYLATLDSFRGAPDEALIRAGAASATIRADTDWEGRQVLVEAELLRVGRNRVHVNKQRLGRTRDLLGVLRVTVFAPDDLALVKEGPAVRRRWLDDLVVAVQPRHDALRSDVERILRQRGALLRQVAGTRLERLSPEARATLDVWDAKLVDSGEALVQARRQVLDDLAPGLEEAYRRFSSGTGRVRASYLADWEATGLAEALAASRVEDLRRGVTTVGPHRDDVVLELDGMAARAHASQGEQRSYSLALRLAGHQLVTDTIGSAPILLLDDVFSELDPSRSRALLEHLPAGQTLLTSAGELPEGTSPELVVRVRDGALR